MHEMEINNATVSDPIILIIPCDIRCREFKYTIESGNKRHLVAKCGDGSKIDYPDITPLHINFNMIDKDEFGNTILIKFVRENEYHLDIDTLGPNSSISIK